MAEKFLNSMKTSNEAQLNSMNKNSGAIEPKSTLRALLKLIENKPRGYQYKDLELKSCGLDENRLDLVRGAISKAEASKPNVFTQFLGWSFEQVFSFLNTIFKFALILFIFLFSLQLPYIQEQANKQLQGLIFQSELSKAKYELTVNQLGAILKKFNIKPDRQKEAIPETLKNDKVEAEHWLKYKGQTIESIWRDIPKDWSKAKDKFDDLMIIYKKTKSSYTPGLPTHANSYKNAGIASLIGLILYTVFQNIISTSLKRQIRQNSLKQELKKVI